MRPFEKNQKWQSKINAAQLKGDKLNKIET